MTLGSIYAGDIVQIDKKGRRFLALVEGTQDRERKTGELAIRPVDRGITYRSASAREVIKHWRRRAGGR